jgi:hypothetical protein
MKVLQSNTGAAEGCGVALQASCLEGFDTLGLHQNLLSGRLGVVNIERNDLFM